MSPNEKGSTRSRIGTPRQRWPEYTVELLESRVLLAVAVDVAGATGEESLALQIDGQTVRTWNDIGGDFGNGVFETLTYDVSGVAANQIRLVFVNDGETATGEDRNLRIDKIDVDGRIIETESSNVLSTGTWDAATGCAPGFKQSEVLHCDGYFDFSNVGSAISILAAGALGTESIELRIDGTAVATWDDVGGDYNNGVFQTLTYVSDAVVSPDQIRVAFVNDRVDADGNDRNVRIDGIRIDGIKYESEGDTVFSIGSWRESDGCDPGFKQSEFLHCDGYLEFSQPATGSRIQVAVAGATGTEQIELLIDSVVVATLANFGGDYNSGNFYETLNYQAVDTVTANQVRVAFVNDGNDAVGNDRNVRVDGITIDGIKYESESDTVFSTGSWRDSDGCEPGFKASEFLHCGGFLQFATPPANPGVIALATSIYNVNEDASTVDIVIERNQGSDGIATIDYQSFDATAVAGDDYTAVSGRAIFQAGETTKTVSIAILPDLLAEGDETFTFTIDNVGGTAALLAPRTATVTIQDTESTGGLGGFELDVSSFDSSVFLDLNGSTILTGGRLRLTDATTNQAGSAFYGQAMELDADTSFRTSFVLQLSGGQGTGGADGMTFVLQDTLAGSEFLGSAAAALGYGGTGSGSLAIEFDTFENGIDDINDNHVAVIVDGTMTAITSVAAPVDLNDGAPVNVWIEYDGGTDLLTVYVSANATQPATAVVETTIDLVAILEGGQAYFGFTAATGGLTNVHEVKQWTFESSADLIPLPDPFAGELVQDGFVAPTAIDWSNDDRNLYVSEKRGIVYVIRDGVLLSNPVVDISDHVNGVRDRGLLDIAIHPDLTTHPYLYLLYTYDPPEVFSYTGLGGPDGRGNRAGRMTRVTLDVTTDYTTVVPDSEFVMLGTNSTWDNFDGLANSTDDFDVPPAGILPDGSNLRDFLAADSESHTVGSVEFGPDGFLYVSNGDGASYNQVDPRAVRVQDIDNLSGKILRIDPITGQGLADNPFYDNDPDSNRSKVYQYGLRNPFRISVGPDGQVYIGDVGWSTWEEVNAGGPGDNFGWPYYEGGDGVSLQTNGYQNLPEAQAFYASGEPVVAAMLGLSHSADGINAIVVGEIYTGTAYPSQYQGDLLFNDLGQGIVRNISFDSNGDIESVSTFATGAEVVVQMRTGPDGFVYYVDLDSGFVGRWVPESSSSASATGDGGAGTGGSDGSGGGLMYGPATELEGVTVMRRQIRISDQVAGPLVINLKDGVIATDQGFIEIPATVRSVTAVGSARQGDAIHIVGSPFADRVITRRDAVRLATPTRQLRARGFGLVKLHGGDAEDSIRLAGDRGSDRFEGSPTQAMFVGSSYSYELYDFESIQVTAGRGGQDEAILYDSTGDDRLEADHRRLVLSGEGYSLAVAGFSQTTTYSLGGDNVAYWNARGRGSQHMSGAYYVAMFSQLVAHELNGIWRLHV